MKITMNNDDNNNNNIRGQEAEWRVAKRPMIASGQEAEWRVAEWRSGIQRVAHRGLRVAHLRVAQRESLFGI